MVFPRNRARAQAARREEWRARVFAQEAVRSAAPDTKTPKAFRWRGLFGWKEGTHSSRGNIVLQCRRKRQKKLVRCRFLRIKETTRSSAEAAPEGRTFVPIQNRTTGLSTRADSTGILSLDLKPPPPDQILAPSSPLCPRAAGLPPRPLPLSGGQLRSFPHLRE